MFIGCPTEIKNNESRVALTPAGVVELVKRGHDVLVQTGAGIASGIEDSAYVKAGARIASDAAEAWSADVVIKVKEPLSEEYGYFKQGQILFTYLHLAADPEAAKALMEAGVTAIAYETVTGDQGLPLLAPMSEVAGRLAAQVGAYHLMRTQHGAGVLLSGVPGTAPGKVTIIGGGVVGESAARIAVGLGAQVTLLDVNLDRLRDLSAQYGPRLITMASNAYNIAHAVADADLVIGSVLIPGAAAPKLVTHEHVLSMREGAVLVDIAIDQGGCFADSHPTTHDDPTFIVDGKVFYCVTNMPGAVPVTSTAALTNATLPFLLSLADKGWRKAMADDPHFTAGLNTAEGKLTNAAVGEALGLESVTPDSLLSS
ncbi:alanine dehydrogenase [Corynebacterium ulcerans]|uniref:Alanine dehydrogenase n=1 Tax=Corynebacterium ulcerans TaxID=65058 RepID=A0ABD0BHG3_CORUL|nr:alanine dehydrogenase [Corynebacterium ulcerans]KPH75395.1 alanine dehydrogenase [Corynebacterium ulcerans]OIS07993.1 alanine dehydrogenase [Corynebacterium ulcerans]BAM27775.1 alanine dehydrogenase [Corynebacterium ulcerans 0102]BBJ72418.1 alanine dehydrogenase [Corynebacterium ulcerans]BBJ74723.1 alanine dehydrogenase [Corynebacterium ulcerans]